MPGLWLTKILSNLNMLSFETTAWSWSIFHSNIIIDDESKCYDYDPETNQQSCQCKRSLSPHSKTYQSCQSNSETMLIFFFKFSYVNEWKVIDLAILKRWRKKRRRRCQLCLMSTKNISNSVSTGGLSITSYLEYVISKIFHFKFLKDELKKKIKDWSNLIIGK